MDLFANEAQRQERLKQQYIKQQTRSERKKLEGKKNLLRSLMSKGIQAGYAGEIGIMYNNVTGKPSFYEKREV